MMQYTHPDLPDFVSPAAFTLGGVQHPRVWWNTVSEQEIADLGFTEYVPPEPDAGPPPVPYAISRRQIITGLAKVEWITKQEAIDALSTGARPAAVEAVIATLPEDDQFDALTKWIGFTEAYRDDPLVLALAAAEGKTEAEIDDFFRMCAAIE